MNGLKYRLIGAAFEILALSGMTGLMRRFSSCRGVIFTMHRVLPEPPAAFAPNAILQITPDFLEAVIEHTRALGIDIVSLDEALRRLALTGESKPFVVLTFDDAYRDNLEHALPVLRRHNCPFTFYVPTGLVDGKGEVWWQALEDIIAAHDILELAGEEDLKTATLAEKNAAFDTLYKRMRKMPEPERVRLIRAIAKAHDFDLAAHCRDLIMTWQELKTFADEPLCTIAAHTVHHYELSKLPADEAEREIATSADVLEKKFGTRPEHFSYPIGSRIAAGAREYRLAEKLGFRSATTTIPGGLYPANLENSHALPRISLNGNYQNPRYIDVFLTGMLFSVVESVS